MAAKIKSTISFSGETLTVEAWTGILASEELIFKIVDPLGTTIYINDGYDASDFTSPDITQGVADTLEVDTPLDDDDEIVQGTYILYYLSSRGKGYGGTVTLVYCITEPTIDVDLDYACRTSTITSTDSTDYDIYCSCSESDITPTITRTHTVKYPTTMEVAIADEDSSDALIAITPIWTKYWTSRVTSYLEYTMPSDAYTGDTLYEIVGTITGIAESTVVCDDCLCVMYDCINSIINKYLALQDTGAPDELQKYETVLFNLLLLYQQHSMAEGCETEADVKAICGKIQILLQAWDCTCETAVSVPYSVEITPISGGTSTTTSGTKIYNGDGVPSVSLGNNDDYYFNNTTGGVYKKVLGLWVLQFTMQITALVSNQLLYSNNTAVISFLDDYTELKSIEFDITDVQEASVLQMSANLRMDEPTGDDTAIRVNLVGTSTDSTTIPIDAAFDESQFPLTLEVDYYVKEVTSVLTIIGKQTRLLAYTGVLYYNYEVISIPLNTTLTPNEINILVKSDDNITSIYLDNIRLNHLRTS